MEVIFSIDYGILRWIAENLVTEPLTVLMRFITALGNNGIIWILIALLCLIRPSTRKCGFSLLIALLFSLFINNILLKSLVARARPFLQYPELIPLISPPGGYSFPSGHSSSSFAAAAAYFFGRKKGGIPLLVLAALIAFSRLYVCVHFPTDVLCGSVVGILLGFAASRIVDFVSTKIRSVEKKKN